MAHELPALTYDYAAIEPAIDEKTMHLHHDMHHAAYVKNLNAALEKYPNLQSKSAEDLIREARAGGGNGVSQVRPEHSVVSSRANKNPAERGF